MVDDDLASYEDRIRAMRRQHDSEMREKSHKKDQEYRILLEKISHCVGSKLQSFDDLPTFSTVVLEEKISQIAQTIATEDDEGARHYAIVSLLGGDDFFSNDPKRFSMGTLLTLFHALPHGPSSDGSRRGSLSIMGC